MEHDIFAQLGAEAEAPPPPPNDFDSALHNRLNRSLLFLHITEFVCKTCGYACAHFARGVLALIVYTFSGRYVVDRNDRPPPAP